MVPTQAIFPIDFTCKMTSRFSRNLYSGAILKVKILGFHHGPLQKICVALLLSDPCRGVLLLILWQCASQGLRFVVCLVTVRSVKSDIESSLHLHLATVHWFVHKSTKKHTSDDALSLDLLLDSLLARTVAADVRINIRNCKFVIMILGLSVL